MSAGWPVGTPVLLIGGDWFMPPIGAVGTIYEPMDADGDYGVMFDGHPCPHPPGTHWYAHRTWLVRLDRPQVERAEMLEATA